MSTRAEELKDYVKLLMEVAGNQGMDLSMEIGEAVKELHKEMGFKKDWFYKGGSVMTGGVGNPHTINTEPLDIKPWIESYPNGIKLKNSDIEIVSPIKFSTSGDNHEGLNFIKKNDYHI